MTAAEERHADVQTALDQFQTIGIIADWTVDKGDYLIRRSDGGEWVELGRLTHVEAFVLGVRCTLTGLRRRRAAK